MRARRSQSEWTPPHGTAKVLSRRTARARLAAWTRRILDRAAWWSDPEVVDDDEGER